jgi:CelD/BcsL family acetyltransferase involved in cellulose biosynthesis
MLRRSEIAGDLSVQLIEGEAELAALGSECERLASASRPRLPFATSNWLTLWWRYFREDRWLVRDRLFVHALRDAQGTLVALAPLMLTERPAAGPLRARCITFLGVDKNITELRGLICAPEHEGAAARALLEHLTKQSDAWDWFAWDGVRQGGEAHELLSGVSNFRWRREVADYVLTLPDSWDAFRATRSRNVKESLRKCYNSLIRDGHVLGFRVVSEADELPQALEGFFRLHTLRSRATDLADHADYFSQESARQLLRGLAATPERAPALRVFELRIAGQLVASRLGFLLGDELYLYFSGFDPAWARYSVMTTTVAEAIKWAIERKLRVVNLSAGTDVSKTRWGPTVVTTCCGILVSTHPRARLKWELAAGLNRRSRALTWFSPLFDFVRRRT